MKVRKTEEKQKKKNEKEKRRRKKRKEEREHANICERHSPQLLDTIQYFHCMQYQIKQKLQTQEVGSNTSFYMF